MDITYLGHSSFRIKAKNCTVITDPYDSKIGLKFPKVDAQIVTISHDHEDHSAAAQVDGNPHIVSGPGEYEIGGVSIFGISCFHDNKQGEERGKNTIYVVTVEGVSLCHLGDLGHKLSQDHVGEIGNVDVLFIPVGGFYTIDASEAVEIVSQLEPKFVVPMHYKVEGLNQQLADKLAPVENFIKELGVEPVRDTKLTVALDKIPEEMQVVVLERKS